MTLYGLNNYIVSKIALPFNQVSTKKNSNHDEQELIKLLGDEYVALEHNELNMTRVNISLILSELSK